jgi:hypothetical protein
VRTRAELAPSAAEAARTVVEHVGMGVLATLGAGFTPHAARVCFVADGTGDPVLVLATLEPHVRHAWLDPRAGLCVDDPVRGEVGLSGELDAVPGFAQLDLEPRLLARHPHLAPLTSSLDAAWLRLRTREIRHRAPDGTTRWIDPDDYRGAAPDPLAADTAAVVDHLAGFGDDLAAGLAVLTGRRDLVAVRPVHVDRYGLTLAVTTRRRAGDTLRLPFRNPVADARAAVREVLEQCALATASAAALNPGVCGAGAAPAPAVSAAAPPPDGSDSPGTST